LNSYHLFQSSFEDRRGWLPAGSTCPLEDIIGFLTILTIFGLIIVLIVILYFIVLISDQVYRLAVYKR
jgi:hypothetical protein